MMTNSLLSSSLNKMWQQHALTRYQAILQCEIRDEQWAQNKL